MEQKKLDNAALERRSQKEQRDADDATRRQQKLDDDAKRRQDKLDDDGRHRQDKLDDATKAGQQKQLLSQQESTSRYNNLKINAARLDGLVKKYGTAEVVGPEEDTMRALVYSMAIDYAKLVDPESVAREGEVAAAQKYMLPFVGKAGYNDTTARKLISEYVTGIDQRLKTQDMARKGERVPPGEFDLGAIGESGAAYGAPGGQPLESMDDADLDALYNALPKGAK